jgi:lipopolysaccharide biosynthesis glycosyltransferase
MNRRFALLATLNAHYVEILRVLVASLERSNPNADFDFYILHKGLLPSHFDRLATASVERRTSFHAIVVSDEAFAHAPTSKRYPLEIYYRLFASAYLPPQLDRILYLDPDIVALQPIDLFYDTPLDKTLFVGATHTFPVLTKFNQLRMGVSAATPYLNTGVLLMNLCRLREIVQPNQIVEYIDKHRRVLMLPDQDLLIGLFGNHLTSVDPLVYNLSDRYLRQFNRRAEPKIDVAWIEANTVFVHYCGRNKPWRSHYLGVLDRYYLQTRTAMKEAGIE